MTEKKTKWVIQNISSVVTSGSEVQPFGEHSHYTPQSGAPVFTMNPLGYKRDVNVNNAGSGVSVPNGNCLHLYNIGTSAKITAEWVESQKAYRLRSYLLWEERLNAENPAFPDDLVWDVDGQSLDTGAVAHVWSKKEDTHLNQMWRFIPHETLEKVYYVYNVNSKLYLSLEKMSDENNVKLVQSDEPFAWEIWILNQNDLHSYEKGKAPESINGGNWMAHLPDNTYLSELNMPGTHDAGATRFLDVTAQMSATICQQLYPDEQLNAGIRAWDIRIDKAGAETDPDPRIVHGGSLFAEIETAAL